MKLRNAILVMAIMFASILVGILICFGAVIMRSGKIILLVLLLGGRLMAEEKLLTPAQAVAWAARDLASVNVDRRDVRYFTLYNVPEKDRQDLIQTFAGHVNGLSTESDIIKPALVPGTENSLLRVLISDYGWSREVWEKLAKVEPYFHSVIEEEVEIDQPYGNYNAQGKFIITEHRREKEKQRRFSAQAPWIGDTKAIAFLVSETGSECPLVRADWFLWQTGLQADRTPGYYDFLGVKTLKDFQELVGFDAKLAKKSKRVEFLEAVAESGIAQQPRRIRRDNTIGGMGLWTTFDNKSATDKNNPLRVLDNELKFDASELFGPLPNNLWAYALFAANGDRQDSAPDFIGRDSTSRSNDGRIHVGLSCIRCHSPNAGLNDIDAWARNLLQPPLAIQSPLPDKIRQIRQQYLRDLLGPIDDDRQTYKRALREATGFTPKEYAQAYGLWFARYDGGVDVERAARDLGVATDVFRKALEKQLLATGSVDTVLSVFLLPKERQRLVQIRQWQEAVPLAHLCLASYGAAKK